MHNASEIRSAHARTHTHTHTRKVRIGLIYAKTRSDDQGIVPTHQELLTCRLMPKTVKNVHGEEHGASYLRPQPAF